MPAASDNLLKLLAFFDLFNYPLTARELWSFSQTKQSYNETLEQITAAGLAGQNGFYFLPASPLGGPEHRELIVTRQERYNIADQKFQRALKAAWWFAQLPWIKLVCLANQIGAHNLRAEGDLDFFIVTSPKRLWLSRLILAGVLKILNLRPSEAKTCDTLCLSFWVDANHLALDNFRLAADPYFRYWLACLIPLYDCDWTYERLIAANGWLTQELPNWQPPQVLPRRSLAAGPAKSKTWPLVARLENLAKNWQLKIMPANLKTLANQDTRVVINDGVLKLHPIDRRQEFLEKYQDKISKFQIPNSKF
jgi:hypothetical protein